MSYLYHVPPPVAWLDNVHPRVHKMYHAPPPLATIGEENFLYFHRLLLLLISHLAPTFPHNYTAYAKLIFHKFYTLT